MPRRTNVTVTFSEYVKEATVGRSLRLLKIRRDGTRTRINDVTISCQAASGGEVGGDSCRKATLYLYGTSRAPLAKGTR